ncbi:hypothetical protein CEXT_151591 [Caerostris extrusa]|uniref:Maturase K n=1 Tax=Caerostris extrusa TaxID=172846 RepID=A0AAV4XC14_CAEEX|nr:hypothetical protein CEXT_151591 [Caerostris extrusa]
MRRRSEKAYFVSFQPLFIRKSLKTRLKRKYPRIFPSGILRNIRYPLIEELPGILRSSIKEHFEDINSGCLSSQSMD